MFLKIVKSYLNYFLIVIILIYLSLLNNYVLILINILFHMILYIDFMLKLYLQLNIIIIIY